MCCGPENQNILPKLLALLLESNIFRLRKKVFRIISIQQEMHYSITLLKQEMVNGWIKRLFSFQEAQNLKI